MASHSQLLERLYHSMSVSTAFLQEASVQRMQSLDEKLLYPSKRYPIVHVAGTNGKGSTVLKMAQACRLSGLKVGVYTSPHLECITERIQIADPLKKGFDNITYKSLETCLSKVFHLEDQPLNFFELLTAASLEYFAQEKVDLAILEVGVGGRFDSTNFITPILSVITSISYDHCHLLGHTLEAIGWQKAGIIKEGIPVVLGPTAALSCILEEALLKKAPVFVSSHTPLLFDEENSHIARLALEKLPIKLKEEAIALGLQVKPPCRLERFSCHGVEVIFDVAHNEDGLIRLIQAVKLTMNDPPLRFLVGFSVGKELQRCAAVLKKEGAFIHLVSSAHFKLLPVEQLYSLFLERGVEKLSYGNSLGETVNQAVQGARHHKETLVICGSFYIMNDVKNILNMMTEKERD